MGRLGGKHAFVTAAGDGIGRAVAIALASEGAHVFATSRSTGSLDSLKTQGVSQIAVLDVTDNHAVGKTLSTVEELDILVSCAGIVTSDTVASCIGSDLEHVMSVNLFGAYHVTKASLPKMIQKGADQSSISHQSFRP